MSPTSSGHLQSDVGVVIPSGGRGVRAGEGIPKQFRPVAGVPMLLHSIRVFTALARVREVVVPLPEEFVAEPPSWLATELSDRVRIVAGGENRTHSVLNGVRALSNRSAIILIHDAARPCVSEKIIQAVIASVASGVSAIAAAPVTDTIKRSRADHTILETVSRDGLWGAHTPQGFPRDVLMQSYDVLTQFRDPSVLTDEASLVARAGHTVKLVADSSTNLKVTTPEDFAIAEALLSR